jgi:glycosyltransferase involved in cell wall biosynthesis
MPGQALYTFRKAKVVGIRTCLNHASGPVRQQILILSEEFKRAGLSQDVFHGFDNEYFERETEEYALSDLHCVASTIVRNQLIAEKIPAERIWIVPYAANTDIFYPTIEHQGKLPHRILYAGQLTLRKGLRILLESFKAIQSSADVELHLFGPIGGDFLPFLHELQTTAGVNWHGPVSQLKLADEMRRSTVLVLPSWEEAFGIVVPQALNCGIPCIVSDRVGASDLIRHHSNGSIFPVGNSSSLSQELTWWLNNSSSFVYSQVTWDEAARKLLSLSTSVLSASF